MRTWSFLIVALLHVVTFTNAAARVRIVDYDIEFTKYDFKDLMEGVMKGAMDAADPIAEICLKNGVTMMKDVQEALEDIRKDTKESTEAGIKLIGQVIQEASGEIVNCEVAVDDFENLAKMADFFSSPVGFFFHAGKNIIIHHVEIYDEINTALASWDAQDYPTVGYSIGEALAQVLVGAVDGEEYTEQVSIL